MGEALLALEEFEEAEEIFSKGCELAPTNSVMHSLLKKSRVQASCSCVFEDGSVLCKITGETGRIGVREVEKKRKREGRINKLMEATNILPVADGKSHGQRGFSRTVLCRGRKTLQVRCSAQVFAFGIDTAR